MYTGLPAGMNTCTSACGASECICANVVHACVHVRSPSTRIMDLCPRDRQPSLFLMRESAFIFTLVSLFHAGLCVCACVCEGVYVHVLCISSCCGIYVIGLSE